jgi:hypothetical protein
VSNLPVEWRLVLCDLKKVGETGDRYRSHEISMLDGIASGIQVTYMKNRAAMLSFTVPSEDARVNIIHTDDEPYLTVGKRAVKGYRRVGPGPGGWELRFAGRVWSLEDHGDGDTVQTAVTCFDPLKILEKRVVRASDGSYDKQVGWFDPVATGYTVTSGVDDGGMGWGGGAKIIREAIERTRDFGSMGPDDWPLYPSGIDQIAPVHIDVSGFWQATAGQSITCDQMYVMELIDKVTSTMTVDLNPTGDWGPGSYVDALDAVYMKLGAVEKLGSDKTATVSFNYAVDPFTAEEYGRTKSLEQMANFIHLGGKSFNLQDPGVVDPVFKDQTSMDDYLVMEAIETISDVEQPSHLRALARMELALRKDPRDLITIRPTPEDSPLPFDDYWLGDTVTVQAASSPFPVTRETIDGVVRLYGFTITLDDDYGEHVTEMVISPQGA